MEHKNSRQFLFELCKRTLYNTTRRNNIVLLNMSGSNNAPQLIQQPTFTCHDCELEFNDIFAFLEHSYEQNSFDSIDAWTVPFTEDKFCKICLTYKQTRNALIHHIARHLEEAYAIKMPSNFNNQQINNSRANLHNQPYFYKNNNTLDNYNNNKYRNEHYKKMWKYPERITSTALTIDPKVPMQFNSNYNPHQYRNDEEIIQVPYSKVRENQIVTSQGKEYFNLIPIQVEEFESTASAVSATSTVTSEHSRSPGKLVIDEEIRSEEDSGCVADLKQTLNNKPAKVLQVKDGSKTEEVQKDNVQEIKQTVEKKKEYFKEMQRCKRIQCKFCQRSFHRQSDLLKHMNKYDTKCVVNVTCCTCARVYRSRKLFEKHVAICKKQYRDEPKTFLCDLCGQAYARSNFLATHVKHGHDKVECTYCDKKYKDELALKAHEANVHFKSDI